MFYRKIEPFIEQYFKSDEDRILCINGARQVGKTFIINHLAKKYFKNYIEINMADDFLGDKLFENVRTVEEFYLHVSVLFGDKMGNKEDTIIFIDEIQVYPHLLTLLKPLRIDDRFRYICSGSLLGLTLSMTTLIPMGSIVVKTMYPLDFHEFLLANGVGEDVINHLEKSFKENKSLNLALHNKILNLFKRYLIVGGLPDAVKEYVNTKNINNVRLVHDQTSQFYISDAGKYDEENKLKIKRIYEMKASFIDNKVKRIMFNQIEEVKDSRYAKYIDEFDYLVSAGISLKVNAVSEPKFPLISSTRKNLIKLYYNDVGLLSNILYKNNISAILDDKTNVNLGAVYETVAATELTAHGHKLHYFDRRKAGEIDFLIDDYDNSSIIPIEIKSGHRDTYRAMNKVLNDKNYNVKRAYVFSNEREVNVKEKLILMPIYFIMFI